MDKDLRSTWIVDDWVEVYSASRDMWYPAQIIDVYTDEDEEWIAVFAENKIIKEVQRYADNIRPQTKNTNNNIINTINNDNKIEEEDSDKDDNILSSSESLHSADDDAIDLIEKHELVLVFVERCGTSIFHGKYVYSTTTEEGYPIFEHINDRNILIKQNEWDLRWEFISNKKVYYYSENEDEFPPSAGWSNTKLGKLPNPGVRLDSLKPVTIDIIKIEDDPYKYSPFDVYKHKFNIKIPLGFDMKTLKLHQDFVAVKYIEPNSQAEKFGIRTDDVLVSINGKDLSQIKSVNQVNKIINDVINELNNDNNNEEFELIFARKKNQFTVLLAKRAGTKHINGKYSIKGKENDALLFVHNDNPNLTIQRIYVEKDEAVWVVREINIKPDDISSTGSYSSSYSDTDDKQDDDTFKDYYMAIAPAIDLIAPEFGWKAIEPNGTWPAVGLQHFPIDIEAPIQPKIINIKPNPKAVRIHFECSSELKRRPTSCPHMDVWYEIEMKHYKYKLKQNQISNDINDTKMFKIYESPFVADGLKNGDGYEFIVRTCNFLSSTNSNISQRIIPLQLPPKPVITDIHGDIGILYIKFECDMYNMHDIQASFEIIIEPHLDENNQLYDIKDNKFLISEITNKPIQLNNIEQGTKYEIKIACVNTVGVTCSSIESIYTSSEPPQPKLISIEPGNQQIQINFKCDDFDKTDDKGWFELDINPAPPNSIRNNNDQNPLMILKKTSSKKKSKLKRKAKWRRSTKSQRRLLMSTDFGANGVRMSVIYDDIDDMKQITDNTAGSLPTIDENDYNNSDFIPRYRRYNRYYISPIIVSPVINGTAYTIAVKAITLCGTKTTQSRTVTPFGLPPIPKISKLLSLQSSVKIFFECNDLATKEYAAKYEIRDAFPHTLTHHNILSSPFIFDKLTNGKKYQFQMRAINKQGATAWCQASNQAIPLKIPPKPKKLKCVAYDHEITVFWICGNINHPKYSGWYEVESFPATRTMVVTRCQAKFRNLINGKKYTFRVTAINKVGKKESKISKPCIPNNNDFDNENSYLIQKKEIKNQLKGRRKVNADKDGMICTFFGCITCDCSNLNYC